MVVCKFFVQGTCRFGESCRFEHQLNDRRTSQGYSSVLRQQSFMPNTNNATRNIDLNTLVQAVSNDMIAAEKGKQWLLSCYSPFKEKANMPGFEDQSVEEVRFGYYSARASGTVDQFVQQFQIDLQTAANLIRALQNPSAEAIATISNIYNSPGTASSFGQPNVMQQTGASIFGQANQQMFGAVQPQQSSIFGAAPNVNSVTPGIFGSPAQQQTAFGSPSQQQTAFGSPQQQQSVFGLAQGQQSVFGGATTQQSGFGSTLPQQTTFGTPQPQQGGFGGLQQQSTFTAGQPPQSGFGATQPQAQQAGFGSSNFSFLGQHQQTVAAPPQFNQQPPANASIFNSQPIQAVNPAIFNQQQTNQAQGFGLPNGSIQPQFAPISQPPSIFGAVPVQSDIDDKSTYSKLEDLSESDIRIYQTGSYEFGKIPEKPPTKEMCF